MDSDRQLRDAAYRGDSSAILEILRHQPLSSPTATGTFELTALHLAARGGHASALRLMLLQAPENVNVKDAHGTTPLHYAGIDDKFFIN